MNVEIEMYTLQCATCGIVFAISKDRVDRLWKCHNDFFCPAGHPNVFNAKTEEEKLREQMSNLQTKLAEKEAEISRLSKPKRKVVKK